MIFCFQRKAVICLQVKWTSEIPYPAPNMPCIIKLEPLWYVALTFLAANMLGL